MITSSPARDNTSKTLHHRYHTEVITIGISSQRHQHSRHTVSIDRFNEPASVQVPLHVDCATLYICWCTRVLRNVLRSRGSDILARRLERGYTHSQAVAAAGWSYSFSRWLAMWRQRGVRVRRAPAAIHPAPPPCCSQPPAHWQLEPLECCHWPPMRFHFVYLHTDLILCTSLDISNTVNDKYLHSFFLTAYCVSTSLGHRLYSSVLRTFASPLYCVTSTISLI